MYAPFLIVGICMISMIVNIGLTMIVVKCYSEILKIRELTRK